MPISGLFGHFTKKRDFLAAKRENFVTWQGALRLTGGISGVRVLYGGLAKWHRVIEPAPAALK
jgi:hypothetical protein